MRRPAFRALSALCLIIAALLASGVAYLQATDSRVYVMQSGSMTPEYPTGSLVFARETPIADLSVGQVIAHQRTEDGVTRVHRVVETDAATGEVFTAGDVTGERDLMPATDDSVFVGVVEWTSPIAGVVWQLAPFFLGALILATILAVFLPAGTIVASLGFLTAAALAVGSNRTGALFGIEVLSATASPSSIMVDVNVTTFGVMPANIDISGSEFPRTDPGTIIETQIPAQDGGNEYALSAKLPLTWQVIAVSSIPSAVYVIAATFRQIALFIRRRKV